MEATIDGEERVMATAQHILKTLGPTTDLTNDMISILSTFDHRFSDLIPSEGGALDSSEETILRCEATNSRDSLPWEESPDDAAEYLLAVDHILDLLLSSPPFNDPQILDRAETLLQIAMSRLEDEFRHVLLRNAVPLDAPRLSGSIRRTSASFASTDGEICDGFDSSGDGSSYEVDDSGSVSDPPADLLHADAVPFLRDIACRMLRAGYEKECCQAYITTRRDALDECLSIIGVERLSIEEVQKIEWRELDEKMKKWAQAVKITTRVLLSSERLLCDGVFGPADRIAEICFEETAKGCVMQLLNFGEAVSIGRPSSEKLFRILDMYDALAGALLDLQALFPDDDSSDFVLREARAIMNALGDSVKGTFAEFENAVRGETSQKAMQGGEIHPLTRYVMNYIKLLVDYSGSLNSLLDECNRDDDDIDGITPIGRRLVSLISYLESNLEEKSKLYEDIALQYVFLMNNILYLVQKIKDSELGPLLGDQWVRKRRGQIRQYSTSYLRASWTRVLNCLKDEGLGGSGSSSSVSKMAIKDRFKNFNFGFEEIYRNQTGWKVSDPQLREELRLSVSEKVIPAYRSFMGRFGYHLESGRKAWKYIKYSPEDIENLLLDLFEGSPASLNHPRRKLSI